MIDKTVDDARAATLALLAQRQTGATVCPSEVARALTVHASSAQWREAMPVVHAAVDTLLADGSVCLSWKGQVIERRTGPYRISLGANGAFGGA